MAETSWPSGRFEAASRLGLLSRIGCWAESDARLHVHFASPAWPDDGAVMGRLVEDL